MATIRDVAARAGVSEATVSRVVNDTATVAEATRARVLAAIAELGYRPSNLARSLSLGRSSTVAAVIPPGPDPGAAQRLEGATHRAMLAGHELSLYFLGSGEEAERVIQDLARPQAVGGVLVISVDLRNADLARLGEAGLPVVLLDRTAERVHSVCSDHVAEGRVATEHLLALGHNAIAFVTEGEPSPAASDRLAGYRAALEAAGIAVPSSYHRADKDRAGPIDRRMTSLYALHRPPTAVVAASDLVGLSVLAWAWRSGLPVPTRLSIIGFEGIDLGARFGLSTVGQPLEKSGSIAVELLIDLMERRVSDLEAGAVIGLPVEVIDRGSTAPVAGPP